MDMLTEPLFDFCEHVKTVQLGLDDADLDMGAVFLNFLDDSDFNSTCMLDFDKNNYRLPVRRKQKKIPTVARIPFKKQNHDAPHSASSQSCIPTVLEAKKWNDMGRSERHKCTLRRRITNDTYLRRLYMPPVDVITLFPSLSSKLLSINEMRFQRCQRLQSELPGLIQDFVMTDASGKSWPVTCDCKMLSSGAMHCRLTGGWSRFCRDNNVAVHDEVVLTRCHERSVDVSVHVERRNASV